MTYVTSVERYARKEGFEQGVRAMLLEALKTRFKQILNRFLNLLKTRLIR